jgi:Undecaprenyl-phosphate glucose phosphotransferase
LLKQRHQIFAALLVFIDVVLITLVCMASWVIRLAIVTPGGFWKINWPTGWGAYIREPMFLFAIPLALYCFRTCGLYKPRRDGSLVSEVVDVVKASLATTMALVVLLWAFGSTWISGGGQTGQVFGVTLDAVRLQVGAFAACSLVLLSVQRVVFRLGLRAIRSRGRNLRHVAIIGTSRLGRITCRTLERNSWTGIAVDYFISHQDQAQGLESCVGRPVLGGLRDLEAIFDDHAPDAVYIAVPNSRASQLPSLLRRLERYVVDVRIVPDVAPRYMPQSMTVNELEGMPILSVRECPVYGLGGAMKRVLDIVGSACGLLVFGPVMLGVMALVRFTSPGPVIFKQRRVSLGGEEFNIYKFRTMFEARDEQDGASWTKRNDPRITPVGRWLRRTSLDELPQLFNVLRGDMSLVGPRPERPELIARFRDDWRGYMLRQHVKAGITGWAQVNGLRGDTSIKKRLQYDLVYIRHWSLGFDFKILWLTLFRGFVNRNAH